MPRQSGADTGCSEWLNNCMSIICNFAGSGSFKKTKASFWIACDETDELQKHDWLRAAPAEGMDFSDQQLEPDFFYLTEKAACHLKVVLEYSRRANLGHYTASFDEPGKLSVLELIHFLAANAWAEEVCPAGKNHAESLP